jgi:hypothetical protein
LSGWKVWLKTENLALVGGNPHHFSLSFDFMSCVLVVIFRIVSTIQVWGSVIRTQKLGTQKDLLLIIFLMMISWIQVTLIGLTYLGKQGKEITLQGKEINLLSCHTENRFKGEIAVGGWTGLAPAATSLIGQLPALVKP